MGGCDRLKVSSCAVDEHQRFARQLGERLRSDRLSGVLDAAHRFADRGEAAPGIGATNRERRDHATDLVAGRFPAALLLAAHAHRDEGLQGETLDLLAATADRNTMYLDELRHFLDCARARRQPEITGEDGLRVLEVLAAARDCREAASNPKPLSS